MKQSLKIREKALAGKVGIVLQNIEANVKTLKQAGFIDRAGSAKGEKWIIPS